jgi:hypothetical protein
MAGVLVGMGAWSSALDLGLAFEGSKRSGDVAVHLGDVNVLMRKQALFGFRRSWGWSSLLFNVPPTFNMIRTPNSQFSSCE